ncbi:MAG: response regulator [Deltaproteobacteria bacterium]|nr:response regulator [Deltaproteobacteria bacterium]
MKFNILLVDDEPDVLEVLKMFFEFEGHKVFVAESAKTALDIFNTSKIDLVISDYRMPETNGIELIEKILLSDPEAITILLTAHADVDVAIEAINRINLYKFVRKPWDNQELSLTVKRALESRELILENKRLVNALREREKIIKEIEKNHPGITDIKTDQTGRIIIEDENKLLT